MGPAAVHVDEPTKRSLQRMHSSPVGTTDMSTQPEETQCKVRAQRTDQDAHVMGARLDATAVKAIAVRAGGDLVRGAACGILAIASHTGRASLVACGREVEESQGRGGFRGRRSARTLVGERPGGAGGARQADAVVEVELCSVDIHAAACIRRGQRGRHERAASLRRTKQSQRPGQCRRARLRRKDGKRCPLHV